MSIVNIFAANSATNQGMQKTEVFDKETLLTQPQINPGPFGLDDNLSGRYRDAKIFLNMNASTKELKQSLNNQGKYIPLNYDNHVWYTFSNDCMIEKIMRTQYSIKTDNNRFYIRSITVPQDFPSSHKAYFIFTILCVLGLSIVISKYQEIDFIESYIILVAIAIGLYGFSIKGLNLIERLTTASFGLLLFFLTGLIIFIGYAFVNFYFEKQIKIVS